MIQLDHPRVHKYYEIIKQLESKTQFQVLRFWNRRWEYPFILSICDNFNLEGNVLDAGAGKSLMPHLLSNEKRRIIALDIDDGSFYPMYSLNSWYQNINNLTDSRINFVHGDLMKTDFSNDYFDFVYSLSVLEHLSDPLSGLIELWRILKPGGVIAITIDLSLDNSRGMYNQDYNDIKTFFTNNAIPLYPEIISSKHEMFTTDWFKKNEPEGLPWVLKKRGKKARIKNFFTGKWNSLSHSYRHFSSLLLVGLAYRKPM